MPLVCGLLVLVREWSISSTARYSSYSCRPCRSAHGGTTSRSRVARPARLSVTDYHHLLLVHGLELEPLARPLSRVVKPRRALGDYALLVRLLRLGEFPLAELADVLAVAQQRIARQYGFQGLLALKQRLLAGRASR